MTDPTRSVRIGGAAAFVGDSILGPRQLVDVEGMRYLVFDYLAEMTLSSFAHARKTHPGAGYASDFVDVTLREILPSCARRGVKIVANAGGLNPAACAAAVERLQAEIGTRLRVAWIEGDDCMALVPQLLREDARDFYTGEAMPPQVDSANAYLGAFPIARALALGADIVITGRIVDSATTLGVLIHEFGWSTTDHNALAGGALAGHLLECGTQATGGIFTDWEQVPDWENIGYPFVDVRHDGSFELGKPEGTGGLVSPATVSEQILYEVGDPARYLLPDVSCDFSQVTVGRSGRDRVRVAGARGMAPPPSYKVSFSHAAGWRCVAQVSVFGIDAVPKARRTAQALLGRARRLLAERGLGDFDKAATSVIGAEDGYGPHAVAYPLREAIARVAVTHERREALELFAREARAPGVSFAPGTTSGSALTLNAQAAVEPRHRLFTCLVDKSRCSVPSVHLSGRREPVPIDVGGPAPRPAAVPVVVASEVLPPVDGPALPLIALAHGRSGDKGDTNNIAIIARDPEFVPLLARAVTEDAVAGWLGHLVKGPVRRFAVPGLNAFNFVLDRSLDGGGPSSLRTDPMGKGLAQMLLELPVHVPSEWLQHHSQLSRYVQARSGTSNKPGRES